MTMLDFALGYAARGWPVFPIREAGEKYRDRSGQDVVSEGKEPATKNGFLDATTDPAKVRAWWTRYPNRNIGLVTSPQSGMWVLDADVDKETGEFGMETLAELKKEHGSLPPHPIALTPGGGEHHFFAWPDDGLDVPRKIRFQPGLDALGMRGGKGGYLVAVPSIRPEGEYRWQVSPEVCPLPQAPGWLLALVRAENRERPADMARIAPVRSDATSKYGRSALLQLCAEVAGAMPGHQEVTLSRVALRVGSLAHGGNIELNEAYSSVLSAAMKMRSQAGREPWTEIGIDRKIRTAFAKAAQDPTPPPAPRNSKRPDNSPPDLTEADAPMMPDDAEPYHEAEGETIEATADATAAEKPKADKRRKEPFRYLGFNRDGYYYLPDGKVQVVGLRASEHTPLRMLEIADMTFWASLVDSEKITKEHWLQFANGMIRASERVGIFDPTWVRGRGAWVDGKQIIVHTGSELIVNGETTDLRKVKSRFVYEAGAPWEFGFGTPATTPEAHRLVQICERLTWADKMSGALLAGWNVVAPICGALDWRSHIWITGPSGAGKTTALNDVVGRIAGPAAERFDGKATEASIRQIMGYDARPVILDEAETEDQAGAIRMQGILDLARVSSSGGRIPKGGSNHKAVIFLIRSAFCFSSINTAVRHHADETRISKLVLLPNRAPDAEEQYAALLRDIEAWFTPEYASAMFARSVKYLPTLLRNCKVFTAAAAVRFKSRRAADQLGAMLAGYYLCHSTGEVTLEKALEWISQRNWEDYVSLNQNADEMRLFEFIMSRTLRVGRNGGMDEVTIGRALELARSEERRNDPYTAALGAKGIKYEDEMIGISDSADVTRSLFRDKPQWQSDWKGPLRNLPGAIVSKGGERFGPGVNTRATWVPFGLLDGSYRPREPGDD